MELVTRPEQQQSQQHQQNQSQQQHHQRHHQSPIRKGGGGGGGGSGGYSRTSGQSNQSVVFQRGGGSKKAKHSVHWFRKGLRLMDNPALLRAVRNCDTWRCIFILDPWSAGSSNQVWSHLRSSIRSSTLQSMMNAKLRLYGFWSCHENGLIRTNGSSKDTLETIDEFQVDFPLQWIKDYPGLS